MPYFQLFRKAKTILNNNNVILENHIKTETGADYFFKVKDKYNVSLRVTKLDDSKTAIWKREFKCDCRASIRGTDEFCSHVIACITYLVMK